MCLNNQIIFLMLDQLVKKYDEDDFNDLEFLKYSFNYESEKIKTFINCEKRFNKIEANLYILSKSFW